MGMVGFVLCGLLWIYLALMEWFVNQDTVVAEDGGKIDYACGIDAPRIGCAVYICRTVVWALMTVIGGLVLYQNLQRVEGGSYWDKNQRKGFRFKDSAFKIPARQALERIWDHARFWCASIGVINTVYAISMHFLRPYAPFYTDYIFAADLFNGLTKLGISWFYSPDRLVLFW